MEMISRKVNIPQRHSLFLNRLSWPYDFLQKLKSVNLLGVLFLVAFIKSGLRGIQPWPDFSYVQSFPKLKESYSTLSVGWLALSKLFSIESQLGFFIMACVLLLIFSSITFFWISKKLDKEATFWFRVWFFLGFPMGILLGNVGRHDFFSIFGLLFFFFSQKNHSRIFAITFAMLGSPEHVFLALVLSSVLILLFDKRKFSTFCTGTLYSGFVLILMHLWAARSDSTGNRFTEFLANPEYIRLAFFNWIRLFPLEWFGYFGVYWLVLVVYFLLDSNQVRRYLVILAFALPMIGTIFLLDKNRDFILIALIPFLIISSWLATQDISIGLIPTKQIINSIKGFFVLLIFLTPNIEVTFEGSVRPPFAWILKELVEFGLS